MVSGLLWMAFFWFFARRFIFGHRRRRMRMWHEMQYQGRYGRFPQPPAMLPPMGSHMTRLQHHPAKPQETPFEALRRRYVDDEITVEEYERQLDEMYKK